MLMRIPAVKFVIVSCIAVVMAGCAGQEVKKEEKPVVINPAIVKEFDKAASLLKNKQYEQAITLLQKLLEKEGRFPAPYVNLGIAYLNTDKEKLAEEQFKKAIAIDEQYAPANNELGLLYRKQGKFNEAKTAYEAALKSDPKYLPARKNLGILCDIYLRDFQCALNHFQEYQKTASDKQVKIWIADLKLRLGNN